jgi:uncharacterized membrane protein
MDLLFGILILGAFVLIGTVLNYSLPTKKVKKGVKNL